MGFNSCMELPGTAHIGLKVSIRLHNEEPEDALFRDLLGILESPTTVRRKNGEVSVFDPKRIAYWKIVPSAEIKKDR